MGSATSHGHGDTTVSEATPPGSDDFLVRSGFDSDGPTHETFAPFPGERIGRYLLVDKLAQGTFGFIFRARDVELDREVALKVLNPDHANKHEVVRRFLQEASATARVVHPGVVTILDSGQYNGGAYIAMDLLDGESLTDRLENCGRLLPHDAVEVARQIAAALEAAHGAGVLHRDLKPDNIFIVSDPSMPDGLRVKILDFGLAKVIDETGSRRNTRVHSVFGTPRYMSPEQCRSSTTIDHRADIYSLGCILFELVTGTPPFDGDIEQVIEAHLVGNIPRASMFTACTPHLDELITQLMAKDPARRPQSMTAVRRALDKLPLGRIGSAPVTPPPQRTPLPRTSGLAASGASSMLSTAPKMPSLRAAHRTAAPRAIPSIVGKPRIPLPPPLPTHLTPPSSARLPRTATSAKPLAPPAPVADTDRVIETDTDRVIEADTDVTAPPRVFGEMPSGHVVAPGTTRMPRIIQGMLSVPTEPGVASISKPPPSPVARVSLARAPARPTVAPPIARADKAAPIALAPVSGVASISKSPPSPPVRGSSARVLAPASKPPPIARAPIAPAPASSSVPPSRPSAPLPPYFPDRPTVSASPYAPTPYGGSPIAAPMPVAPPPASPLAAAMSAPGFPPMHNPSWPRAAQAVSLPQRPTFAASAPAGRHAAVLDTPPLSPSMMGPSFASFAAPQQIRASHAPPMGSTAPAIAPAGAPSTAIAPSMSTAMAMSMAYVPASPAARIVSLPIAIPVGLPAPSQSMGFSACDLEPPPASKLPLIILAIACALSGALAALVLV